MKIAVIGSNGRSGRQVLEQGLSRGHQMTALVRRPETQTLRHDDLVTVPADILDRNRLAESMTGCDAVVSAVGIGTSRAPTVIYSEGITNVLGAMQANEITRLAVVSAAPAAPRAGQPFLERRIMMPVLERFFGHTYDDMRRMESILQASDVDWVVLRPPRLVKKSGTGGYRIAVEPLSKARKLTYGDLAAALLDSLDRNDLYRHAAFVAN